jgi:hypothetical protein
MIWIVLLAIGQIVGSEKKFLSAVERQIGPTDGSESDITKSLMAGVWPSSMT